MIGIDSRENERVMMEEAVSSTRYMRSDFQTEGLQSEERERINKKKGNNGNELF